MKKPNHKMHRRAFLDRLALAGGGVFVSILNPGCAGHQTPSPNPGGPDYDWNQHLYAYLIDTYKCIGCGMCVKACYDENYAEVPDVAANALEKTVGGLANDLVSHRPGPGEADLIRGHYFRTWVERYLISETGESYVDSPSGGYQGFDPVISGFQVTKAFFVPKMCNHCRQTPCVQVCPVGASYQTVDGLILVDKKRCIGCSYCVQACPYGSRFIHPETHTASKCTLCYHRISKGMLTACVQACPVGARQFGDTRKLHDKVSEIIATSQVFVLKPELMTEPNCYYLGSSKEVR